MAMGMEALISVKGKAESKAVIISGGIAILKIA